MRVAVVFLAFAALAACVAASGVHDEVSIVPSPLGAVETTYSNQPVVVVRKTTYYEPELVAVVVEKGVDDIPEETYLIQNYADVLGTSNNEIRLCATDNTNQCLDTPVTKLLVPSLFQSIGQTGFRKFFEQAKEVPWVSTIDDNVQLVNPILSPKSNALNRIFGENPLTQTLYYKPLKIVSPDVFRYIPETVGVPEIRTSAVFPPTTSSIVRTQVPVSYDASQGSFISPSDIQAGFAPLDQITTGGSFLGGATTRTTYQQTPANNPYLRKRRALVPFAYHG